MKAIKGEERVPQVFVLEARFTRSLDADLPYFRVNLDEDRRHRVRLALPYELERHHCDAGSEWPIYVAVAQRMGHRARIFFAIDAILRDDLTESEAAEIFEQVSGMYDALAMAAQEVH